MKFTLTYNGKLPSSGNSPKPEAKWDIRRQIHPQLAELWQTHSVSRRWQRAEFGFILQSLTFDSNCTTTPPELSYTDAKNPGAVNLLAPIDIDRGKFVPLIRDSLSLICGLDILFLRREEPGQLVKKGGDLDNRIKTLFDGLRMPQADEMRFSGDEPLPDPFYCLLQDDSLIAEERVRTARLLTGPNNSVFDVSLIIEVTVRAVHVAGYNLPLLGE